MIVEIIKAVFRSFPKLYFSNIKIYNMNKTVFVKSYFLEL